MGKGMMKASVVKSVPGPEAGKPEAGDLDAPLPRRKPPLWKRAIPFLVAGGILAYLFLHIDVQEFLGAVMGADISSYLPWLAAFILASFLLDTQNLAAVLGHFGHPVGFRLALGIRGVTYLLMTIDWSLGLGALIYYLKRDLSIPVMRSTGIMLFFNAITQLTMAIMAIAGLLLVPPSSLALQYFFALCIGFVGVFFLLVAVLKILPSRGLLLRMKNLNLLRVFHEAAWGSYCILIFWRVAYYSLFIVFFYAAVRAFHMTVPFVVLTAYVPIILLVISLPITPCGFGTAQAAMVYLFRDYGSGVDIMAFGLTYSTSIVVMRSLIGLLFVGRMSGFASYRLEG